MITLYQKLNALGGYINSGDLVGMGRDRMLGEVLDIVKASGFTEEADAVPVGYHRMLVLTEGVAKYEPTDTYPIGNVPMLASHAHEARAIMAEIRPVNPDLLLARNVAFETLNRLGASSEQIAAADIAAGKCDDAIIVHAVREAIKRGRALASESAR